MSSSNFKRRRSKLNLLVSITVLVVVAWFSFLTGSLYASYFDEEGNQKSAVSRHQREAPDVGEQDPRVGAAAGCSCSGVVQNEGEDSKKEDRPGIDDLVLIDRRVKPPPQPDPVDEDIVRMPDSVVMADAAPSENITMKHESYRLTWTQVEETSTTVFSAYYDDRPAMHGPSVVLPGYQSKKFRNATLYCLFRNKDGSTQCSPNKSILMEMDSCNQQKEFDKKKERQFLHVFHICQLIVASTKPATGASDETTPTHVALSANENCELSTTMIPIYKYRPKEKIEFGVCIQTPAFDKTAQEFVSFIELYRMLGAQFFTLYVMSIDHLTLSFLRKTYGGENGILDIIHWTNQLNEKEPIHYYGEILAIHDCLYRNMYSIEYLAFVDLDEAVVPRRYHNWRSMLNEIDQPYVDSFIFANSIFMKTDSQQIDFSLTEAWSSSLCNGVDLPVYFTNFNRVKCVFNYFSRSKLIVKPELIVDTDIHGVCTRVHNTTHYLVPEDSAVSQHYRTVPTIECRKNRRTRKYPTKHDNWMIKYAEPLLKAVRTKMCVTNKSTMHTKSAL